MIKEVTITSENLRREVHSSDISMNRISMSSISNLPTLLGEGDILKTMQLLPGSNLDPKHPPALLSGGQS